MSAPVDVLKTIDLEISAIEYQCKHGLAPPHALLDMQDARAAVAELIEVIRAILEADDKALKELSSLGVNLHNEERAFLLTERARAALSRVGGAA
ncbi:hypothetical protein [Xanthomonas campestris]|uniref:hypothetical protein n=1 Tax=Xanthomonas campestris TaxID=339 RepID=UPI0005AEE8D2|nr:hypothetical protein [Xanthomonas campestris]KIQ21575.1 hypothetical protein RT95_20745 [Xanthomonas campestris]